MANEPFTTDEILKRAIRRYKRRPVDARTVEPEKCVVTEAGRGVDDPLKRETRCFEIGGAVDLCDDAGLIVRYYYRTHSRGKTRRVTFGEYDGVEVRFTSRKPPLPNVGVRVFVRHLESETGYLVKTNRGMECFTDADGHLYQVSAERWGTDEGYGILDLTFQRGMAPSAVAKLLRKIAGIIELNADTMPNLPLGFDGTLGLNGELEKSILSLDDWTDEYGRIKPIAANSPPPSDPESDEIDDRNQ